jgi:hypothetical protein
MIFFTALTPAENLIIRDQRQSSYKQMLELTFMDLLLKKVLKIEYVKDETTATDQLTETKVAYVSKGENYYTYAPVPHEKLFMKPFITIVTTRILLSNLIKVLYENAEGPRNFRALVALSPRVSNYLKGPRFFPEFGFLPLNKNGIEAKEQIFSEQTTLSGNFVSLWNNDRVKAMDIISKVNGNIFLLPLSMQMVKSIGFELDTYTSPSKKEDYSAGGCGGFYYSDYDHVSGGFSEHEPSSGDSSGADSGCGGDSGCSGCGGCGGD